jgi:hypothetical protein
MILIADSFHKRVNVYCCVDVQQIMDNKGNIFAAHYHVQMRVLKNS